MANKNLSTGLVALLAGVGIGAVAGILFAPEKGSVLRKRLHDRHTEGVDELKRKVKGLKRKVKEKAVEKEHEFEARFNNLLAKADHKADDVIVTLEKKLNELKELKAKSTNK